MVIVLCDKIFGQIIRGFPWKNDQLSAKKIKDLQTMEFQFLVLDTCITNSLHFKQNTHGLTTALFVVFYTSEI